MDTSTIKRLLKNYNCFGGVYPLDMIPSGRKKPLAIIINTHKSDKPGEHWVSVMIDKNGFGEYFDSFGLPPLHGEIITYLNKFCKKGWCYNPIPIQNVQSNTCGHYCVLYVMFRCQGYSYDEFMSEFGGKTLENDTKMNNLFGYYTFGLRSRNN
jgi:hypothetical protein